MSPTRVRHSRRPRSRRGPRSRRCSQRRSSGSALMLAVAVLADVLMPYDYAALDLRHRLAPPLGFGGTPRIRSAPTNSAWDVAVAADRGRSA